MADALETAIGSAMAEIDALGAEDSTDPAPEAGEVEQPEPENDEIIPDGEPVEDVDSATDHEDSPDDESEADEGTDDPEQGDSFTVKVDGEEVTVTLDELRSGYQRQADYTRKTQELKQQRDEVDRLYDGMKEWYETRAAAPGAWVNEIVTGTDNPAGTLAEAIAASTDPTGTLAQTIRSLAEKGQLSDAFVETFGLDDVHAEATRHEQESRVERLERELREQREKAEADTRTQSILAEYDRQWDAVKAAEGIRLTPDEELKAKVAVMKFARDQRIGNLETAYAAMAHKGIAPRGPAAPATPAPADAKAAVERKRATRAMARKPVGGPSPKARPKGLEGAIDEVIAEFGLTG